MRGRSVWHNFAWGLFTVMGACSGGTKEPPPGDAPPYPDLGSFCGGLAKAVCNEQVWQACSAASASACSARRQQVCVAAYSAAKTYVPAQGAACIEAASAAYADGKLTKDETASLAKACAGVVEGPGAEGSSCGDDLDCRMSQGLRCIAGTAGVGEQGSCRAPRTAEKGDSCAAPDVVCAEGAFCSPTATGKNCLADAQAGESCGADVPCAADYKCASGTCQDRWDDGHACDTDGDCKGGFCSQSAHVCGRQLVLSAAEPACGDLR